MIDDIFLFLSLLIWYTLGMETKTCNTCGTTKPTIEFTKNSSQGIITYRPCCKECKKARRKASLEKSRVFVSSKKCTKCGEQKPIDKFHKNSLQKDGHETRCKLCTKEHNLARSNSPSKGPKACSSCKVTKPFSEFYIRKASSDGLNARCKSCQLAANAAIEKDPEKIKGYKDTYRKKVKAKVQALLGNKCNHCGYNEDPRALQVDHIKANHGISQNSNKRSGRGLYVAILNGEFPLEDFQLLCARCNWVKRYENNEITSPPTKGTRKKEVVGSQYERIRNNPESQEKRRIRSIKTTANLRTFILDLYGNKCNHCGYNEDLRALQVDHIEQAKEDRNAKDRSGEGLYRMIKNGSKNKEDFQLLCANCNFVKRYDNQEHRHPVV